MTVRWLIVFTFVSTYFGASANIIDLWPNHANGDPSSLRSQPVENPEGKLDTLKMKLKQEYARFSKIGFLGETDLYPKALNHIEQARDIARAKPRSDEAQLAFQSAWWMAKAAYLQIAVVESKLKERKLEVDIEAVMKRLDMVRDSSRATLADRDQQLAEELRKIKNEHVAIWENDRAMTVSISDLLFDVGASALTDKLKQNLVPVIDILKQQTDISIEIEGHTDNMGSEKANQELSELRARAVMDFLVSSGILSDRLNAAGYGFTKPVASNDTEDGRKKNRRVDIVIHKRGK